MPANFRNQFRVKGATNGNAFEEHAIDAAAICSWRMA